jgi:L-aspartate oxidase
MWRKVGLIRERDDLTTALAEIDELSGQASNTRTRNFVTLARLIATAALWREESRGGHFRSDFPLSDDSRIPVHSAQQIGKPIAGISRD